jgi:hypothetical protein
MTSINLDWYLVISVFVLVADSTGCHIEFISHGVDLHIVKAMAGGSWCMILAVLGRGRNRIDWSRVMPFVSSIHWSSFLYYSIHEFFPY